MIVALVMLAVSTGLFAFSAHQWRCSARQWREAAVGWRKLSDENFEIASRLAAKVQEVLASRDGGK